MSQRPPLTHFLCLPLVSAASRPLFEASMRHLAQRAASYPELASLAATSCTRPVGSLHLTLGVMSLQTPERIRAAADLLHHLDLANPTGPTPAPIETSVVGLEARPHARDTSVLWIPFHDAQLHAWCSRIRQAFETAGLVLEEDRGLLLHMTVFNTIYAPRGAGRGQGAGRIQGTGRGQGAGRGRARPARVDARRLVDDFSQHVWAESVTLDRIAICQMGAQKVTDSTGQVVDEVYKETAVRMLPQTQSPSHSR